MPPWFRFYNEAIDDRKLKRVARDSGQPLISILGAWSVLMTLANNDHLRGYLMLSGQDPYTRDDIVDEIGHGLNGDVASRIIFEFEEMGMLKADTDLGAYHLPAFSKRQYESDSSTERVQRFRKREAAKEEPPCNADETLQERFSNAPETETETEHSRAETDNTIAADAAPPPPTPPKNPKPAKTKTPALTAGQRGFLERHGAKRFKNRIQAEAVLTLEQLHGTAKLLEGATWTAKTGMTLGKAVLALETALPKWGEPKSRASPDNLPEAKSAAVIRAWAEERGV